MNRNLKVDVKLEEFIKEIKKAEMEMQCGKPEAYINLWADSNDITAVGASGNIMVGEEVTQGPKRVAQFSCGSRKSVYSQERMKVFGDLAYLVWLYEGETLSVGSENYAKTKMAVTHVLYRCQNGWRVFHRHNTMIKN